MATLPESVIANILSKIDIVDLVSSYVPLQKKSSTNYFGLCPFHSEKTPSFSVTPSKQIFYCFGCHKGGNAIKFIEEIEHLSFPEALQFLAEKAGVDISDYLSNRSPERDRASREKKKRLAQCLLEAARFFYHRLQSSSGYRARQYLEKKRQLKPQTTTRFGLGYADEGWDTLSQYLLSKNYTTREILESGLARSKKNGELVDLFRNRIMFPVFNDRGELIAFGGRALTAGEPKYVNSPETLLFHKRQNLFGLNLARQDRPQYLILTEGYMDTITLHEAGFTQAVAGLGTALTTEQVRLMIRYVNRVYLCFDSDEAGQQATLRALNVFYEALRQARQRNQGEQAQVRILEIPGAKDPDEYIHQAGAKAFQSLIDNAITPLRFQFKRARRESTQSDGEVDWSVYQEKMLRVLAHEDSAIEREKGVRNLAQELQISPASILEELNKKRTNGDRKTVLPTAPSPGIGLNPTERFQGSITESAARTGIGTSVKGIVPVSQEEEGLLRRDVFCYLGSLLESPQLVKNEKFVLERRFWPIQYQRLFELILDTQDRPDTYALLLERAKEAEISPEQIDALSHLMAQFGQNSKNPEQLAYQSMQRLQMTYWQREIVKTLQELEASNGIQKQEDLVVRIREMQEIIDNLRNALSGDIEDKGTF